jgi:DNA-binding beta-propeller fold protein YncE
MKKIVPFWLMLISFIVPTVKLYAQIPKLNTAFYYSSGIVMDSKGNAFVSGKNNNIIKITPEGKAELFAGGGRNYKDGKGKEAGFFDTGGIAIDSSDNLYVADGSRIRKISPDAEVITIAGTFTAEVKDGHIKSATFLNTENIAVDNKVNIYVTDYSPGIDWRPGQIRNSGEYLIRKISADGVVTTIKDGNNNLILKYPRGLACDAAGNLYVCASVSHCLKKISPSGAITTVAGQCDKIIFNSIYKEGNINSAVLTNPSGIAIAKNGDIYISDDRLNRIIKIANNKVITVAGCGKISFSGNIAGASETGETDGKALQAMFHTPMGIAFDKSGNLYIVDGSSRNNSYIRKLSTDGIVTTFCKHVWNPKTQQYEEVD